MVSWSKSTPHILMPTLQWVTIVLVSWGSCVSSLDIGQFSLELIWPEHMFGKHVPCISCVKMHTDFHMTFISMFLLLSHKGLWSVCGLLSDWLTVGLSIGYSTWPSALCSPFSWLPGSANAKSCQTVEKGSKYFSAGQKFGCFSVT